MVYNRFWRCVGPIILSALSLFISFLLFQPLALFLSPSFNLLASRGVGKVAFVTMAIYQILLLLAVQPAQFLQKFLDRTFFFFIKEKWIARFSRYFLGFFTLHALLLLLFYHAGYLVYQPGWGSITHLLIVKTLLGLFVVFMLAWTEELIFRGTIYPYIAQYYSPITSLFATSLLFMTVHNLQHPLALLTSEWKLGLGLFLLGMLLNLTYMLTGKLYTGMGIHAGLVFVKVILRRARFVDFAPTQELAWWVDRDLRQSHLVHVLFLIVIIFLLIRYKKHTKPLP